MTLRYALPLMLSLAGFVTGPAAALDLAAMSEAERAAFRAEVRAYLLDNPEVLMEAIAVLEDRQRGAEAVADQAMVQANAGALFDDGFSWVGGNPEGDITMVEFMDYRCSYCKRAKELPILGPQSVMAAQFAVAVQQLHGEQAYKGVHDALMQLQGEINAQSLGRMANGFGLDAAPIMARMEGPEVAAVLEANRALAQMLQISGTPTFVIEDQMVRGYVPLAQMELIVADLRGQ